MWVYDLKSFATDKRKTVFKFWINLALFKLICPIFNAFKCIKNDTSSPPFNIDKSDTNPTSSTMMKTKLDAMYLPGDYFRCKVVFKDLVNDVCEVKIFDRKSSNSLDSDDGNDMELGEIKSSELPSHYQNM